MTIYLASDHAGFTLKEALKRFLIERGYFVEDMGANIYDADDDYTDFIPRAAEHVSTDPEHTRAIVLGGSGQGEAMLANRYPNVRAAVYYGAPARSLDPTLDPIVLSREHNDANVLSLGARFLSEDEATEAVLRWLQTEFGAEERHVRRIGAMEKM